MIDHFSQVFCQYVEFGQFTFRYVLVSIHLNGDGNHYHRDSILAVFHPFLDTIIRLTREHRDNVFSRALLLCDCGEAKSCGWSLSGSRSEMPYRCRPKLPLQSLHCTAIVVLYRHPTIVPHGGTSGASGAEPYIQYRNCCDRNTYCGWVVLPAGPVIGVGNVPYNPGSTVLACSSIRNISKSVSRRHLHLTAKCSLLYLKRSSKPNSTLRLLNCLTVSIKDEKYEETLRLFCARHKEKSLSGPNTIHIAHALRFSFEQQMSSASLTICQITTNQLFVLDRIILN
ncbi:hypothetical protein AGLY_001842 [Aphis glycines]|uniref:Uncharacterized protein n=1 Tax=Aphis glycines TaxID=307491 RepID=A0A6G0U5D5_APHGL|nr:hypothetical protein AGLY_001842 [Aphis glycines]